MRLLNNLRLNIIRVLEKDMWKWDTDSKVADSAIASRNRTCCPKCEKLKLPNNASPGDLVYAKDYTGKDERIGLCMGVNIIYIKYCPWCSGDLELRYLNKE